MKRVYTLYRVSTKKQVNVSENHDNDIPMQRGACKEFVKYRQDWEIVKEYEEKGVSGFKVSAKNRDAILDLQEAALNKEFDVLLVFMYPNQDQNPAVKIRRTIYGRCAALWIPDCAERYKEPERAGAEEI